LTAPDSYRLHAGKLEDVLPDYPDNFFDSIVTDSPYGIGFMGKEWDRSSSQHGFQLWMQDKATHLLRVLKPGGYLINFSSPRMYHRMVSGVEDAGFEIRDQIFWVFASGFPKSHNLDGDFDGWGTALKPAHEPIVVARKPLKGSVARNMQTYGVGAMNIDACRVDGGGTWKYGSQPKLNGGRYNPGHLTPKERHAENIEGGEDGRWPANLIHDGSDEVTSLFPYSRGQQSNVKGTEQSRTGDENTHCYGEFGSRERFTKRSDNGTAARFFYCAKTSPTDRNEGLDGITNDHPTVKPTTLCRYLIKLVTPSNGIVLDPFMGSGSFGKGAMFEHMRFVGIDKEGHNIPVAEGRIKWAIKNRDIQIKLEL
jgi:hypothetical protein